MTLSEARQALRPPLVFGDEGQIRAVRLMERADECLESYKACAARHEEFAPWYARRGESNPAAFQSLCDCVQRFESDVREAAASLWEGR